MSRLWLIFNFLIIFNNFISFEAIKPPYPSYTDILISKLKRPAFFQRIRSDSQNLVTNRSYILPDYVRPKHYDLKIKTDIKNGAKKFQGSVEIKIEILNFTNEIVLHSRELQIDKFQLVENDRFSEVKLENLLNEDERDFLVFKIADGGTLIPSTKNYYFLRVEFHGDMRNDEKGFFMSSYLNENKTKR